jgi:hypothetical protein
MPTDPFRPTDDVGDPAKLALLETLLVIRLSSLWIGEDPTLTFDARRDALNPTCWIKDGMRKMKLVSIEFWHREVTTTVEGSAIHGANTQPDAGSAVTVCPTCGNPGMTIVARTDGDVPADVERVQRALQQYGLQLQDTVAPKPPGLPGNTMPESSAT